jgi:hypothetical protein
MVILDNKLWLADRGPCVTAYKLRSLVVVDLLLTRENTQQLLRLQVFGCASV